MRITFAIRHSSFVILLLLALPGCSSTPTGEARWYAPATWFKGSESTALARAQHAEATATAPLVQAAREAVHETTLALASAPASRPVEVATHSSQQAATLLDQLAGPLTAAEATALRTRVAQLLSQEAATRAQAEAARADRDAALGRLSTRYEETQAALNRAQADLQAAFTREHAVAQEARAFRARLWWGGGVAALIIVLLWLIPLFTRAIPALAPLNWLSGLLNPGLAYVAHRATTGLARVGHALAEMPPEQRAATITHLDALTDADHQRIIAQARKSATT